MGLLVALLLQVRKPLYHHFLQNVNFALKQIQWYFIGFVAISVIMIIDFDRYQKIAWYLYSFAMILLIGLELQVPGAVTIKGATAWYRLPGIGNFQPSEIMKLFLIIVIGRIIANHNEKYFFEHLVKILSYSEKYSQRVCHRYYLLQKNLI